MAARETRGGKLTKQWILDTAIKLFNKHGSQAVSTKRLAAEMGISPGNLYYHFKNKEEIIRALFLSKLEDFKNIWGDEDQPPLHRFLNSLKQIIFAWQDHRFFKLELVTLLIKDPELKKIYHISKKEMFNQAIPLFERMIEDKVMVFPKGDRQLPEDLLTVSWIIVEYWLNYLSINDIAMDEDNMKKGLHLILQVWQPYLTPLAMKELKELLI